MSAGPDPRTANAQMIEQERRRLSARLDEVARLCEGGLPPHSFYGEMLQRLIESLAAVAGTVWLRTPQGNLQQQFQINLQQVGLDTSEEAQQMHAGLLRVAFTSGQQMHLPPNSTIGSGEEGRQPPGNPTGCLLLIVPVKQNEQVIGLVEIFQGPNRPTSAIPGFLQYMSLMADLAGRYQRNQMVVTLTGQQQLWTQLEAFARLIHSTLNPIECAIHIANEGRRLVDCDRVCVAIRRGGEKSKVEAVSGTDIVEHRSNLIRCMRKLSDAVINWGEKLVFQGVRDDSLPPKVLETLDAYLAEAHSKMLVVMPLTDEREGDGKDKPKQKPRSALIMECFETSADPQQTLARLDVVSKHASSALYNAVEYQRIPMRFLWMPLAKLQEGLGGKTKAIVLACVAAVSLIGAGLWAFTYPLQMEFTGQAVPVVRRTVYTPVPGRVERFEVKPGDLVRENQGLALLYDSELFRKATMLAAEIKASDDEATALRARIDRENSESEKANMRTRAALREADSKSKRLELDELWKRTNMRRDRAGQFDLRAPEITAEERRELQDSTWLVLTSGFQEKVGSEVKPAEPIMRLGMKEGPWELEIKIPQRHIGQVLKAFDRLKVDELDVNFLLQAETTRLCKGKLHRDRIAGEATPNKEDANDTEPFVLAFVRIKGDDIPAAYQVPKNRLTSNTEVRGKINCGPDRAGYSLFYGVWEFLYEKVWFYVF